MNIKLITKTFLIFVIAISTKCSSSDKITSSFICKIHGYSQVFKQKIKISVDKYPTVFNKKKYYSVFIQEAENERYKLGSVSFQNDTVFYIDYSEKTIIEEQIVFAKEGKSIYQPAIESSSEWLSGSTINLKQSNKKYTVELQSNRNTSDYKYINFLVISDSRKIKEMGLYFSHGNCKCK